MVKTGAKEKREHSYTVGENAIWCSHYGKQQRFLKKLKVELPYDIVILLLGVYMKETKALIQKDACTPMFIVA